jgi:general secretion pathway protein B
MSYILEALKKSDQQRQRGATPTLPAAQATLKAGKKLFSVTYVLIAVGLLCTGIAIGWLRPWLSAATVEQAAGPSATLVSPTFVPEPPALNKNSEGKLAVQKSASGVQIDPGVEILPNNNVPSGRSAGREPSVAVSQPIVKTSIQPAEFPTKQKAIPLTELPLTIQQEIPAMTIQLHSFSSKPENSIVSINSRLMKEGDSLTPELKLEQITPNGVVFSYKGYRFEHGIW